MSQQDYHHTAAAGGFFMPFCTAAVNDHVYDTNGIFNEMFNFPPPTTTPPPPQTDYWIGTDSAIAMQFFVMNPNPRSPPPPVSSNIQSSGGCFGEFTWPGVEEKRNQHSSSNVPNEGRLSLSLTSSSLEARNKAEELRIECWNSSLGVANLFRISKYVKPAQELLQEFCTVGRGDDEFKNMKNNNNKSNSHGGEGGGVASSPEKDQPQPPLALSTAERIEHQRRKVKLLSMLDEVDRRYNHYCERMQTVVHSFEVVIGFGAAMQYTTLAHKAMSRHFRCLKDAIYEQLKHSSEMLGEKDGGAANGITKGETPRLKLLEQSLRHQRAFHQMGMIMEQEACRPQRGLPERSVNTLRAWLFDHFLHPYPSDGDKHLLARQTGLSRNQVANWFINARVRLWKPMVEDMYQQEFENNTQTNSQKTQPPPSSAAPPPLTGTDHPSDNDPSAPPPSMVAHCFPLNHYDSDLLDTSRRVSVLPAPDQELGTTSCSATSDILGPSTLIPPGTTAGDVSLTLGLRHAGNIPDSSPSLSIRSEFRGC